MGLAIRKEKAVKLFKYLGFKTADTWDDKQLVKKLGNISALIDGVKIKNPKMKKLLDKIVKADKIRIKSADETKQVESKTESSTMSKKKKTKKKTSSKTKKDEVKKKKKKGSSKKTKDVTKKSSKKNKTKDAAVNVDKFGSRPGTIKAKINAVLSNKSKDMKQLLKESKVVNSQTGHLSDLIKAGYVVKTDKGYKLKK